jgi:YesN/AraC family two-component response regulator
VFIKHFLIYFFNILFNKKGLSNAMIEPNTKTPDRILHEQIRNRLRDRSKKTPEQVSREHERNRLRDRTKKTPVQAQELNPPNRATNKLSKEDYLTAFDSSKNGELHEQDWVGPEMDLFHQKMKETKQFNCNRCNEMWPTTTDSCKNCRLNSIKFTSDNDMQPGLEKLPQHIKKHFEDLSMIEEMLISPILAVMSVYRLPGGQLYQNGYVANFSQDIQQVCTQLPRLTKDLPLLIVRKTDQLNNAKDFVVNRVRVETILRYNIVFKTKFKRIRT